MATGATSRGIPPAKSVSMSNLSSMTSGSLLGLQRIPRNSGNMDNSDNMSMISSATSIGSVGSVTSIGGTKKRRAPQAPLSNQKRPLPSNAIPEETPSLLRTEEEVHPVKCHISKGQSHRNIISYCHNIGYI